MKNLRVAGALALATALLTSVQAQTPDYLVNGFDSSTETDGWTKWWGSATQTYEFDPSVDSKNDSNSGSLKITVGFDIGAYGGDNQFSSQYHFPAPLDATQYTNFVFDVRFDPSSPVRTQAQDYGYLEYGLIPSDYSQVYVGHATIAAGNTNWVHLTGAIDPTISKLTNIIGVNLKMWAGDAVGDSHLTGNTVMWIDNILLLGNTNTAPTPAPTASISIPKPGLLVEANNPGDPYQRQNILTVPNTGISWVGASAPVTYSITLSGFPDANHAGFQAQIFLVPSATAPGETAPDWNEPNVIFLQIGNNADGSAYANFHYKTNEPSGNTMYYNADPANGPVGALASIGSASPLGKWSLTFNNNTNVTLTEPGGSSTNFVLGADSAALFSDPLYAYFGGQPNQLSNIGQSIEISRVQVLGTTTTIDDTFTGTVLSPDNWQISAANPSGILQIPGDTAFWVQWSLPDFGYSLQSSANLRTNGWVDVGLTPTTIGKTKVALVPTGSVPSSTNGFFRLYKP